jgi:carbon monoxide dehydrogenase subunit G
VSSCFLIEYRRRFDIDAPPQVVWSVLEDFWSWGNSSPLVRDFEVDGQGLTDGTVVSATVATPLAYAMRVELELNRCVPVELIVATVSGDLRGEGQVWLRGDGGGTRAQVAWKFEMTARSLRAVARVAGPILRWGHDQIVESTLEALKARVYWLSTPTEPVVPGASNVRSTRAGQGTGFAGTDC